MADAYDLVVVGSGPGGYAAALAGRRRGWRVALVERGTLGGVCLNVGCIPTKALIAVGHTLRRIRQAPALGIRVGGVSVDYAAVQARNSRIIASLRQGVADLLRHHQVSYLTAEAVFQDAHTLRLTQPDGTAAPLSAERVVIATGASPRPGPWPFDGERVLSYRDVLTLSALPKSLAIVGGGVIGCEFASCFAAFGVAVTLIEQQPQILPAEDPETVRALVRGLEAAGVAIAAGTRVESLTASASGVVLALSNGQAVSAERCLVAIGLSPNSLGLGLERLGIQTAGGIQVDAHLRTSQPHIAAIGDCVAGHGLAHWASYEGQLAVANLSGAPPASVDPHLIPRCVYTDPEVAHVGRLESQITSPYTVSRFPFAALGKSLCDEDPEGFVKLAVDDATGRVLGVTIIGAQASSLIHLGALALRQGLTARQLADTLTAHPTLPEALTEAAAQIYGEALYSAQRARQKTPATGTPVGGRAPTQ